MILSGDRLLVRHLCTCLLLLLLLAASPGFTQAVVQHTAPQEACIGQPLTLSAQYTGSDAHILSMRIYYRPPLQQAYRFVDMQQDGENWTGTIPAQFIQFEILQYFFAALLDNRTIVTFPEVNPYFKPAVLMLKPSPEPVRQHQRTEPKSAVPPPVVVQTPPPEKIIVAQDLTMLEEVTRDTTAVPPPHPATADSLLRFLILSPESQESVPADEVSLAVSFLADSASIDTGTVRLFLDGREVTALAEKSSSLITFQPTELKSGAHWFKVSASTDRGQAIPAAVVSFNVLGGEKARINREWRGHLFGELDYEQFYHQDTGIATGGGDFSGRYGAIEFGGNLFVTSLEDRRYQPRDRLSVHAGTHWLGMGAGDLYPQMNELILWGKRVRGISGFLHLGFFNLDVVSGEAQRAVKSVTAQVTGSGGQDSTYVARYGTFRQTLLGIRPSFGDGRRFQLGLTMVKIKDDAGSIRFGLSPKDNLLLGPDLSISLLRNRIRFEALAAFSLVTNDIGPGAISTKELENVFGKIDLPIDPQDLEDLLVINDSTVPLNPLSSSSVAFRTQMTVNYWNQFITLGYKSIGPEYLSLGNPWLRKDVQGFYLSDRLRLMQNRIYLTLGYEGMADNFSQQDQNPVVDLKTTNFAVTAVPGGDWPSINLSLRDHYRNNHVDTTETIELRIRDATPLLGPDTTYARDYREKLLYRDFSAQLSKDLNLFDLKHQVMLSYLLSRNIDSYRASRTDGAPSQEMTNRLLLFIFSTQFHSPLKTTLSFSSNQSEPGGGQKVTFSSISLGGEYTLLNGKLNLQSELRTTGITSRSDSQKAQLRRDQIRLGAQWQLPSRYTLATDVTFLLNSGDLSGTSSSYNDALLRLRFDKFF